ncbi:MAG: flagellar M-ring protein FliF C-terminal domain-containing protein [Planctomycetota bacterium]
MATDATGSSGGIPRQLSEVWTGMTTANRLTLAGIGLAIVLALAALVASGTRESTGKVPLLEGYKFTASESQAAVQAFGGTLTDYEINGGQILVPRARENDYLTALATANAFPDNFYKAFDDYVDNQRTWWNSQADAQRLLLVAKQKILSKMIASFPEIGNASVMVTNPPTIGMRRAATRKATVRVTMLGKRPLSPLRAEEIRHMVASSFEYLEPANVYVASDSLLGTAEGKGHGADACVDTTLSKMNNPHLLSKESYAECIEHDIQRMLAHLDGVSVVANVEVDLDKRIDQRIVQFEKGQVVRRDTTSRSVESTSPPGPRGEPGVRTNVDEPGVAPNQGATAATTPTNTESNESSNEEMVPSQVETSKEIVGLTPKKVGVVINVPRNFLEATTDANNQTVAPAVTEAEIIANVVALGYPGVTEDSVKVLRFTPTPMPEMVEAGMPIMGVVEDHMSGILFGVLGLVAVIVALVIARRAPVPEVDRRILEEEKAVEEPASLLPELPSDESAMRFEKMQETISSMVSTSPESAAGLLRRWITENEP